MILINGREVDSHKLPYVVAEISGNHFGSLQRAFALIDAAVYAGADAVKTQCYVPDSITIDHSGPGFVLKDGPWKGRRLFDLYEEACTPPEWHPALYSYAKEKKITIFSSVFDPVEVDLLERLGCPAYKIASFELTDIPLIRYAAKTGKPIILSTGMANDTEVYDAVEAVDNEGFCLLYCVSGYPTPSEELNLWKMRVMMRDWSPVGISDHTVDPYVPVMATSLGACMIEKHLKLSDYDAGLDSDFSLSPRDFKKMTDSVRTTWCAFDNTRSQSEESSKSLRRSLYIVRDIKAGEEFTLQNLRSIRPGHGLAPVNIEKFIGQKAKEDYKRGTPTSLDMLP